MSFGERRATKGFVLLDWFLCLPPFHSNLFLSNSSTHSCLYLSPRLAPQNLLLSRLALSTHRSPLSRQNFLLLPPLLSSERASG